MALLDRHVDPDLRAIGQPLDAVTTHHLSPLALPVIGIMPVIVTVIADGAVMPVVETEGQRGTQYRRP